MRAIKKISSQRASVARKLAYVFREWFHTYIWTRKKVGMVELGFKFVASSYTSNRQMLRGQYELDLTTIIQENLARADLFVDVGANIGYYTCLALSLSKSVISIEPKRSNLEIFYQNLRLNGWLRNCQVYPVGVGECPGIAFLYGASGTAASLVSGWAGHLNCFRETISVLTLDQLLAQFDDSCKVFIKVDVEGFEASVLRGARKTLKRFAQAVWVVEICLDQYHPTGTNSEFYETFTIMWSNGFKAFNVERLNTPLNEDEIKTFIKDGFTPFQSSNYLFLKS